MRINGTIDEETEQTARFIADYLKWNMMENKQHPTETIRHIIKSVYGHDVPLEKLINCIETSPLATLDRHAQSIKTKKHKR